ncbi:MAG: hypothetical protein AAGG46_11415, partial [Planctomycetota bacterium]
MMESNVVDERVDSKNKSTERRRRSAPTVLTAALGSLLLWMSQPPAALGWLAWVAPVPWLLVVSGSRRLRFSGYAQLWLAGVIYWLLAVHWVRLPHPLTPIGWFFLAAYLGCYLPAFVWLCRTATRRLSAPLWAAAPIAWTGLELLQAHLFSGFQMGALSHTQAFTPAVIQIADTVGGYGVSFLVLLVAATITEWLPRSRAELFAGMPTTSQAFAAASSGTTVAVVLIYGNAANRPTDQAPSVSLSVAIIQGNTLATWDPDPSRHQRIMDRQVAVTRDASRQAAAAGKPLDLIVWPESMFRAPVDFVEGEFTKAVDGP